MKKLLQLKTMLLLCALIVGSGSVWASEIIAVYTFTTDANGTNTDYTKTWDVVIDGLTWNVPGNQANKGTLRIGGKNITDVDRIITGKSQINQAISNIIINHSGTTSSNLTVNSITLTAASNSTFTQDVITKTVNPSISASTSGSIDITPDEVCPANYYYKISFNVSNSAGSNYAFLVNSIVFSKTVYTITAQSNNNTYGTVELDGTTITATPKVGCRVNTSTPYTVISGTANVTDNGDNTFTVDNSTDCTVQINFEPKPTHSLSSVIKVDDVVTPEAGTVTFGSTTVSEDGVTTATAAANAGYKFTGWSISGTGASLSSTTDNPTTITMGTADATVTAMFEEVTTYAINWSVNGTIIKTENVEENTAINFTDPANGIPAGYVFQGWVTEANLIDGTTDVDQSDNYVTSANSTADITYYAVMAQLVSASSEETVTLDNSTIVSNATGKGSYSNDYNIENWTGRYLINNNSGNYTLQLGYNTSPSKTAYNSHLTTPLAADNIRSLTIEANQDVTFYLCSETDLGTADIENATYGSGSTTSQLKTITINVTGNTKQLHIYPSATAHIKSISMTYGLSAVYGSYCTTVPDFDITPAKEYTTLVSIFDLDFTGKELKAYIAKDNISDGKIKLTQVNKVPAGTGLVLKGIAGTKYSIPVVYDTADNVSGNHLAGSATATTALAADQGYVLSDGVFQPCSAGTLPKGKAYLNISVSNARVLDIVFEDNETLGINAIENVRNDNKLKKYLKEGRLVIENEKGIFSVAGSRIK